MQRQNHKSKNSDQRRKLSLFLGLLFLIFALFIIYKVLNDESFGSSSSDKVVYRDKKFRDTVNKYLQLKSVEMDIQSKKEEYDQKKSQSLDVNGNLRENPAIERRTTVEMPDTSNEESVARLLGKYQDGQIETTTMNDWIQNELQERQKYHQETEEYKKEYARQFVENAKKAGWKIVLDSEYRVLSVTPIKKTTEPVPLFDSGGESTR